jgi:hypothetical protein
MDVLAHRDATAFDGAETVLVLVVASLLLEAPDDHHRHSMLAEVGQGAWRRHGFVGPLQPSRNTGQRAVVGRAVRKPEVLSRRRDPDPKPIETGGVRPWPSRMATLKSPPSRRLAGAARPGASLHARPDQLIAPLPQAQLSLQPLDGRLPRTLGCRVDVS